MNHKIAILIPCYNESKTIAKVVLMQIYMSMIIILLIIQQM